MQAMDGLGSPLERCLLVIFAIERPAAQFAGAPANAPKELVRACDRAHQFMQRLHQQQALAPIS